jgi:hypothetical protein
MNHEMLADALDVALYALEGMVFQYLHDPFPDHPLHFSHKFMSAGEDACDVLATRRPDRWKAVGDGVEFLGDDF